MPLSEQDLRDVLDRRSASPPTVTNRVELVQRRRRSARRRQAIAWGAALAMAAITAIPIAGHLGVSGVHPVSVRPTPTVSTVPHVTQTATIDGVSVRTDGPAVIKGSRPLTVTVTITNSTGSTWRGQIAVGIMEPNTGKNSNSPLMFPSPGQPAYIGLSMFLPDNTRSLDGVQDTTVITLGPGATRTVHLTMQRNSDTDNRHPIRGWIPYLTRQGTNDPHYPDPNTYSLISVDTAP
jgi:hypothetical protein